MDILMALPWHVKLFLGNFKPPFGQRRPASTRLCPDVTARKFPGPGTMPDSMLEGYGFTRMLLMRLGTYSAARLRN
jgi:hypothetical protein